MGAFIELLFNIKPAPEPEPEPEPEPLTLSDFMQPETSGPVSHHDPEEFEDDGTKDRLGMKINNFYEGLYMFLTTMDMVEGVQLDSCKYYAGELSSSMYEGIHIIGNKT